MSRVLRSVRSARRTLSARHRPRGVPELEVAKVELIRTLIPLGLMHIEELLASLWRTLRPQRPVSRRAPSWEQSRDGRVGRRVLTPGRGHRHPGYDPASVNPGLRGGCCGPRRLIAKKYDGSARPDVA